MTYDDDVLRRLAAVDPAPVGADLPLEATPVMLLDRVDEAVAQPIGAGPRPSPAHRWRGPALAAAVFLLVVAIGTVIIVLGGDGVVDPVATTIPPTTEATTTTTPSPPTTTIPEPLPPFAPIGLSISFDIQDGFDSLGTFTAAGPAVDEGFLCASGSSYETEVVVGGAGGVGSGTDSWITHMSCEDRSGKLKLECVSIGRWDESVWIADDVCTAFDGQGTYFGLEGALTGITTCSGGRCKADYAGEIWKNE